MTPLSVQHGALQHVRRMLTSHLFVASGFIPLVPCLASLVIHSAATSTAVSPSSVVLRISTCPSRTINYITQTLPQQCLRTDWRGDVGAEEERRALQSTLSNIDEASSKLRASSSPPDLLDAVPHSIEGASLLITSAITASSTSKSSATAIESTSSISLQEPSSTVQEATAESETDPLSDNANFLSFEEWKAQMLKKAGQSPENVGKARTDDLKPETRRQLGGINNALDSLGEEGEIELDFTGFVNPDSAADALPSAKLRDGGLGKENEKEAVSRQFTKESPKQSRDAGTTSKERFNYASFDCAATVLKTNPECKGTNSVLVENKDSYMLNACSAKNKFIIVELCNDILIDTMVLGNFEFFSSTFRTFRVSISDRYPVKLDKWRELGTFEARNTRGVQAFLVENGLIWARYLRIEFLTHYGNEYYCPVSLLRVHGKTMMDDYRNDVKLSRGEDENDDDLATENENSETPAIEITVSDPIENDNVNTPEKQLVDEHLAPVHALPVDIQNHTTPTPLNDTCPRTSYRSPLVQQAELFNAACNVQSKFCNLELVSVIPYTTVTTSTNIIPTKNPATVGSALSRTESTLEYHDATKKTPNTTVDLTSKAASKDTKSTIRPDETSRASQSHTSSQSSKRDSNSSNMPQMSKSQADQSNPVVSKSSSQPPAPTPTTQESFFKSIHKRLQQLEANSTLSLQYIEEQSRILREAFTKVEKRQLAKTTTFLETLNTTVLSELREFRLQYDQIWQSTVLELSSQREQSQREVVALSTRLTLLADEILWQKRLIYVQFGLILLCLGLVIFPRNSTGSPAYLELPLLQNMVTKPSASFARYLNLDSPPSSRPGSRYGLFSRGVSHLRGPSNDNTLNEDDVKGPDIEYQLPTPSSETSDSRHQSTGSSPEADVGLRRAISTPLLRQPDDLLEASDADEFNPVSQAGNESYNRSNNIPSSVEIDIDE